MVPSPRMPFAGAMGQDLGVQYLDLPAPTLSLPVACDHSSIRT